jgi:hypothetical protein
MLNHSISGSIACGIFRHGVKLTQPFNQANTEILEARDEPEGVSVKARIVSTKDRRCRLRQRHLVHRTG